MGLNEVASGERIHIAFFGLRNAGKSSLVNRITGQKMSVVSDVKGTTTDPVKKTMELLPLGPVVIIDTPGLDDEGALGSLRVEKAQNILTKTDIAVLVTDAQHVLTSLEQELLNQFQKRNLPYVIAINKVDLLVERPSLQTPNTLYVSAETGEGIEGLKDLLGKFAKQRKEDRFIIADRLHAGDFVVLVTPIDEAAPKGRLILPQQLTLREVLDVHAIPILCQDTELKATLNALQKKPAMVITDSQAFKRVSEDTPLDIPLTSFSILMANYKGDLETLTRGAAALAHLKNGDRVLISEGCTHHRQCNDIGTIKIPGWIRGFTGAEPEFSFTSGAEFPSDLSEFKLVVHCGGCMLNEKTMQHRISLAVEGGIPIVNYGVAIAHMNGILRRSLELFPDMLKLLDE